MKLFTPRYYFLLRKFAGNKNMSVDQVMHLKDGKFKTTHQLFTYMLLTWPQAVKYKFLFWYHGKRGNNEKLFGYQTKVTGTVILKKLF